VSAREDLERALLAAGVLPGELGRTVDAIDVCRAAIVEFWHELGPRHGTISSYRSGCRCDACMEVNRRSRREGRKRSIARGIPDRVPHGTASTYTNWACRCEACKAAQREKNRGDNIRRERVKAGS
jgi:hypothetical protein